MKFKLEVLIECKTEILFSNKEKYYYFKIELNKNKWKILKIPNDITWIGDIYILDYNDIYFDNSEAKLEMYDMTFNENLYILFKKIYEIVRDGKNLLKYNQTVFRLFEKILKNIILSTWEK